MNCSTCGDSLSPDARFCPRCGTRAVWEGQAGGPLAQGYTSAQGCTPAQG
ncbi:MAG: zinc-ribbon domain-containing protein, partial [Acidobacteriota bacterium]